jgi:hypothetical protein
LENSWGCCYEDVLGVVGERFFLMLEQLQQFDKSTWYPSNFGKTRKLASNSLANQLDKTHLPARIYARADRGCHRRFPLGGSVKTEIKNREEFLM